ncbi:Glu/Leu/Phe/Val dehydrogenase [Congregibacter sp.]|uniref:Glu/Leu/Phe/Val family dehydrogenase n=1 Tax=Congregibacter sp. TaxID=2744308 RepID=UPI00385A005D
MAVFNAPSFDGHEQLVFASDRNSGLRAIIAVHDTRLGAAVGGCRMYPYACEAEALDDVLRLSRGMTYKSALAGLPLGGGKSVIIGDPKSEKSPELWRAMAGFIDSLGGRYIAAEDSGTSVADLRAMSQYTQFVSGFAATEHGGDPSPSTALGVFVAIRKALAHRLGASNLQGVRIAVQGLGHVGYALAEMLVNAGAQVLASDINSDNLARAESELGVVPVSVEDILFSDVDVIAPCALGGAMNAQSISRLRAGIVAGAANNQLREDEDGARLVDRGILYCPDFLINAGGIIDVHYQRAALERGTLNAHIESIGDRLGEVLERADRCHRPTGEIAEELAGEILRQSAKAAGEGLRSVA